MKKVFVINGPNLNLLGKREPEIYGNESLDTINNKLDNLAKELGIQCQHRQSNHEGDLIEFVQKADQQADGIIINPGGYSHTSIALMDALKASNVPKIEVHITNIPAREEYRHAALTASGCTGSITGLGIHGYLLALRYISENI